MYVLCDYRHLVALLWFRPKSLKLSYVFDFESKGRSLSPQGSRYATCSPTHSKNKKYTYALLYFQRLTGGDWDLGEKKGMPRAARVTQGAVGGGGLQTRI